MLRRLYFLTTDVAQAHMVFRHLLLARISDRQIHFLAREGIDLQDLPPATIFQKNDVIHSLFAGAALGAIVGVIAGIIAHGALGFPLGGGMLIAVTLGAIIGAWSASMFGMMVPSRRLKAFYPALKRGKLLAMVDVPLNQVNVVKERLKRLVPAVDFAGIEPALPSVP